MTEFYDRKWYKQYEKLVEFKCENGHCLVPRRYKEDASLGVWVHTQRKLHIKNTIGLDRKGRLDEIGFVWRVDKSASNIQVFDSKWRQQYEKLVEYKRKNGHCLVPSRYQEDVSLLGKWVVNQRQSHIKNKLKLDRKKLLDEIGFVWKPGTVAAHASTTNDSDSQASTSSVGPPNETIEETEPGQGHTRNRFACPSSNRKRPTRTRRLADARTNPRDGAIGSHSSVENDAGRDKDDSTPSPEVVQEEAPHPKIPVGWTLVKLEPDW